MREKYIEVRAGVRYWEDADVNGVDDKDGSLIPCRNGDLWCPVIRLSDGQILNWPDGTKADIHYKVCDEGEYWLTNGIARVAKWRDFYVPNDFLCPGGGGYGDYIIMKVGEDGKIKDWKEPRIDESEWDFRTFQDDVSKEVLLSLKALLSIAKNIEKWGVELEFDHAQEVFKVIEKAETVIGQFEDIQSFHDHGEASQ